MSDVMNEGYLQLCTPWVGAVEISLTQEIISP